MILDPTELRLLARELDTPACKIFEQRLHKIHAAHSMNSNSIILIPRYWSEIVFNGVHKILKEFPRLKFGSIFETGNKLRVYTVSSTISLEELKFELYNNIDTLILASIEQLINSVKKPFFMK
jgi:hypothetical protein